MITKVTAQYIESYTKENVIEFIYYCVGIGVDAIEFNVCMGDKGELVLSKSSNYMATFMSEVKLEYVFEILNNIMSVKINCKLNEENLELDVLNLIEKYPSMRKRLIISGKIQLDNILMYKEQIKNNNIYMDIDQLVPEYKNMPTKELAKEVIRSCNEGEIKVVNINHKLCTNYFIRILKVYNIKISATGVNELDEMRRLSSLEVFNIITDQPENVLNVVHTDDNEIIV